jgi:hypothetical protein
MCWIDVAQDKDRWQALVNAVMNFWVHKMRGISRLAESLLASEEGLSMELVCNRSTDFGCVVVMILATEKSLFINSPIQFVFLKETQCSLR